MDDERSTAAEPEGLVAKRMRWIERQRAARPDAVDARFEGRAPQGEGPPNRHGMPRVPVGQRAVPNWPVLDLGVHPEVAREDWELRVHGLVERPLALRFDDLLALPQVEEESDFHCVTTWSRLDARFGGVRLRDVLARAVPRDEARHLFVTAYDVEPGSGVPYTTNLPLEKALAPDVLLVHAFEGAPLPREHGGPVRMVTPRLYAWKGAKWIRSIELLATERLGFWEQRGYSNSAEPWFDDRFSEEGGVSAALRLLALPLLLALAPGARQDAEDLLKSKDPLERLAGVAALDEAGGDDAGKLLLKALKDDDWEVVERAARALGRHGGKAAVDPLVKLALEGPVARIRHAAARALAAVDAEEGAKKLAKKVSGRSALRAVEAIAFVGSEDDPPRALDKLLKEDEEATRALAARASVLGWRDGRDARVAELLEEGGVAAQAAVLDALAERPRPGDVGVAAGVLTREALDPVLERRARRALVAGVGAVEDAAARAEEAGARLAELCGATRAATVARGARLAPELVAAGLLDARAALQRLGPALEHPDEGARAQAVAALGALPLEAAAERAAREVQRDASPRVRRAALAALVARGALDEEAGRAIVAGRLAEEPDQAAREDLAVALGGPERPDVVGPLGRALSDEAWQVGACAAVSLGLTRAPEAVGPLARLVEESERWQLRGAAVVGLCKSLQKEGVPAIVGALDDEEPLVRATALGYLRALAKGEEVAPEVAAWTAWWAANGEGVRLYDPGALERRRERYGYAVPDAEIYRGMDVMVLESRGDHIQAVLQELGVEHRLTAAARIPEDGLDAAGVFVSNCTGEVESDDVPRLEWFVKVGGYLFGSCWALHETIERIAPGPVRKLPTDSEVLDEVPASPCVAGSPYLDGVFKDGVVPVYSLVGAHLIEVLQPERVEVLIDSPVCAERWGGGELACWLRVGHGVVLDSVNHFDLQGLENAVGLKSEEDRMAWAVDHMGLSYERLRATRDEKWWGNALKASREVRDLSVIRLVTNFVRLRRIEGR